MTRAISWQSLAARFAVSLLIGFTVPALGFRILYDSVIPEVLLWVASAFVLTLAAPRLWWLWTLGLVLGIVLSNQVPPIPPPGHAAKYGPPPGFSFRGALLLLAFPLFGAAAALLLRAITSIVRKVT